MNVVNIIIDEDTIDVVYNDINVSKWMLEKRLAVEYDGGKKESPESWLKYYNEK